ncbi:MAG: hypothetical protein ACOYN0_08470 [Phycisphaerales bacterium]
MSKTLAMVLVAGIAGVASAQISSLNGFNLDYRNFNDFATSSTSIDQDGPLGNAPTNLPSPRGNLAMPGISSTYNLHEEIPSVAQGNFANRHLQFFSNDGGNTAYQLQANESFQITARVKIDTNMPSGPGAPTVSETGFWFHNPRVNEQGNSFVDEGGLWVISNGTSFTGGAAMDFALLGEGNGSRPPSDPLGPIYTEGGWAAISFTYYAPGALGPGQGAGYIASIHDEVSGLTRSSGLKRFGYIAATEPVGGGFNPGTVFGFRYQNSRFPLIDTVTDTYINDITIVPAPSALAALGLAGLAATRRRR